jgi:hypothetical protein
MRIAKLLLVTVLTIGSSLVLVTSSSAGTLKTSALFLGGPSAQNICVAINVGPSPMKITVEVIGLNGTDTETCTVQPNDIDSSCQAFLAEFAFCKVTAGNVKNVRAVMMNRSTASPFTIFATSEAR